METIGEGKEKILIFSGEEDNEAFKEWHIKQQPGPGTDRDHGYYINKRSNKIMLHGVGCTHIQGYGTSWDDGDVDVDEIRYNTKAPKIASIDIDQLKKWVIYEKEKNPKLKDLETCRDCNKRLGIC